MASCPCAKDKRTFLDAVLSKIYAYVIHECNSGHFTYTGTFVNTSSKPLSVIREYISLPDTLTEYLLRCREQILNSDVHLRNVTG